MNYLNIKTPDILFRQTVNSEIYVDKSMMIEKVSKYINTGNRYICITRPRRFGKSVNAAMLGSYYMKGQDNQDLFEGLQIAGSASAEKHQGKYNVIYIDFSRMPDVCGDYQSYISDIIRGLKEDLEEAYPKLKERNYTRLSAVLQASGDSFIFILDEWDSCFYKSFMRREDKEAFLEFLKNLLKDQPYVALAYMTGILPIAKYSSGSELNMFDEFNFMNDTVYDRYFGFTEEEVRLLCRRHDALKYEDIAYWYDGYYTCRGDRLFNPRSVHKALEREICLNYWTETGPMNEIADCIEHNVDEVREDIIKLVADIPVEAELHGYSASELQLDTRDEILSAMVIYGFLSYYDGILRIPNHELMEKFQRVLSRDSMGEVKEIVDRSNEILNATLNCEEEKVAALLEYVHDKEIPFLNYNDENSLSCVITLCYLYARKDYNIEREAKAGKGYCDYLFVPKKTGKPAIILELKVKDSCEHALEQIKKKGYLQRVDKYKEVVLAGIAYDENKHHQCRIEKINPGGVL